MLAVFSYALSFFFHLSLRFSYSVFLASLMILSVSCTALHCSDTCCLMRIYALLIQKLRSGTPILALHFTSLWPRVSSLNRAYKMAIFIYFHA